jgi:pimeloyl-ACP methyl ester carboxylesterase
MTTFGLVHGAWHGGWCWRFIRLLPRRAGHEVFAPSLTGLGERKHLARPDIDLDTHIEDVVSLLEMEDPKDVVLVGHSYGGMVIRNKKGSEQFTLIPSVTAP